MAQPMLRTAKGDFWITHLPMSGVARRFDSHADAVQFVQGIAADPLNAESLRQAYANLHGGYHGFDLNMISQSLHGQALSLYPAIGGGMLPAAPAAKPQSTPSPKPQAQPRPKKEKPAEDINYKIQLEIAGQDAELDLVGKLSISPASSPKRRESIPARNKSADKHRVEWLINKVENVPHRFWYSIDIQHSSPMQIMLSEGLLPVADTTQQARWPTVLVPLLPLRFTDPPDNHRDMADWLNNGWVYVFLNGYLWRELQVVNERGAMRDVDLGARDGVGDKRVARGHGTSQIVVPHLLEGQEQTIEIAYSRLPFTWDTLCKLGGIAPNDDRFTDKDKQTAKNIARDDGLRKDWLQKVDLSGYGAGFQSSTANVGPIASAMPNVGDYFLKRLRTQPLPVVYLEDKPLKKKVIPVIFVPGIFGSRLGLPQRNPDKPDPKKDYVWDPDNRGPLVKYYAKSKWSAIFARDWSDDEINEKTTRLHRTHVSVMTCHSDKSKQRILKALKESRYFKHSVAQAGSYADKQQLLDAIYQRRAERGWFGTVSDYVLLLEAIELMEDNDYRYVCYASGQDWRNDLTEEAKKFKTEIDRIQAITEYPELGANGVHYEAGSEQVIVVTHSQGGLIARYASEVLGAEEKANNGTGSKIYGMVHLNQPTTGSPLLYRRFITGAKSERMPPFKLMKWPDNVFSEVLGTSSYHFTRMANLAGAYALLPTNDYAHQAAASLADWLTIAPPELKPTDIEDIYEHVYLNDKAGLGLVSDKRYFADSKTPRPYTEREFTRVSYEPRWDSDSVSDEPINELIDEVDAEDLPLPSNAYIYLPEETPWHHDNMRLRPNAATPKDKLKSVAESYRKLEEKVRQAKAFHEALGLKHHRDTYVIRSDGLETVTQVHLFLNTSHVIESPFTKTKDGDGTVPLTSQEALLGEQAKPAGDIITKGKVVHADICGNEAAIAQTQQAVSDIIESIRPATKQRLFVI